MNFKDLGLCPELLRVIDELGYKEPTPVQAKAIPPILEGRDMVGSAQTGTGKTAAFALPTLQRLEKPGECRALALAPTRELAIQIEENFRIYGKHLGMNMALLYGGVKYGKQLEQLRNKPDIVVATPGRLLDHLGQGNLNLKKIEVLILDEVDRMLDMGFIEDVTKIIQKTPVHAKLFCFRRLFLIPWCDWRIGLWTTLPKPKSTSRFQPQTRSVMPCTPSQRFKNSIYSSPC